jgi:hypothetical protein
MKIKLEFEDYKYVTTFSSFGEHRFLIVRVDGKPFGVHRVIDKFSSEATKQYIDKYLVEQMEVMLRQIFVDACAAIEPGTEILPTRERLT